MKVEAYLVKLSFNDALGLRDASGDGSMVYRSLLAQIPEVLRQQALEPVLNQQVIFHADDKL